jgi:hypothetical protein
MISRNELYRLTRNLAFMNGDLREEVPILKLQTMTRWTFTFQNELPRLWLGAIQLNGTATMLIEIKGQTQTLGQKQNEMLKETAKVPVIAVLNGLADGSLENADPAVYDAIPSTALGVSPGDKH